MFIYKYIISLFHYDNPMKIQNTKLNCICKTFDLKLLDKGLFIWTIGLLR